MLLCGMNRLMLLFGCYLLFFQLQAQSLIPVLDHYKPLRRAHSVNDGKVWDDFTDEVDFRKRLVVPGFKWNCQGFAFDTVIIGQGRLMAGTSNALVNAGVFEDVCDRGIGTDSSCSPISWKITGRRGKRILKVEWQNVGYFEDWSYHSHCSRSISFQIWLYEKNSRLALHCNREQWFRLSAKALREGGVKVISDQGGQSFSGLFKP